MAPQTLGLRVAGTLFGLMALVQLTRLIVRPEIIVAGHRFPLWPSAAAVVVLAALSSWLWRLSKQSQ